MADPVPSSPDDLTAIYRSDRRHHDDGRPWVLLNMIVSVDGAIAVDGLSGGLGGPGDHAVFTTLRGLADVVLVAAGTARAEQYRPARSDEATREARRARGQSDAAAIAVVTRSLDLDLDSELFVDGVGTTVVTTLDADPDTLRSVAERAVVVTAGEGDVDLATAIATLADRHGPLVLAEGGPRLNGALMEADVVDELCITVSAMVVGGDGGRMTAGGHHDPRRYALERAIVHEDLLFTRYLRRR
jgi:riboflavin biosynthesis pyrimidine reductase